MVKFVDEFVGILIGKSEKWYQELASINKEFIAFKLETFW